MSGLRGASPTELLERARGGDRAALARLLSLVERGGDGARSVAEVVFPLAGAAHTVGITGSPGAGKSSLTNALCTEVRSGGDRVAVLAIDPSSPFSGGAILGDRVRMGDQALDDGVFIRSMATRGHLGGLSLATPEAARVLDAVGFPWILIETVGVGQVELEVAGAADTTVVVVNPGWGDAVQANKAGLMEIADVFVINKADRPGVADTRRDLEAMLALGRDHDHVPPIIETIAAGDASAIGDRRSSDAGSGDPEVAPGAGFGVAELWHTLVTHRAEIETSGELVRRRAARAEVELRDVVVARLTERAVDLCDGDRWNAAREAVLARRLDPWAAAARLLD